MLDTPKKMRSNTPKWTLTFISILAYGIFIVIMFVNVISSDANERVPFTNLPQTLHLILLTMIWPIVGGFLAVVVFPRLLVPLYLKMKKISNKKYTNCVIYLERPITFKSVLKKPSTQNNSSQKKVWWKSFLKWPFTKKSDREQKKTEPKKRSWPMKILRVFLFPIINPIARYFLLFIVTLLLIGIIYF